MPETLLEHLEENMDEKELAEGMSSLNEFHDDDLAMYPAIEIKEVQLSAQECEIIANNILAAINSASDEKTISDPARALVSLAYNSLMNPGQVRSNETRPLFHSEELKLKERWLRICDVSDLDLRQYLTVAPSEPTVDDGQEVAKLELIRPEASEFERKATIGAWAYFHMRLMGNFKGSFWPPATVERFSLIIRQFYGFEVAYKFPAITWTAKNLMNDWYAECKSGEILFLLYRSIIIIERARFNLTQQKNLLERLAFNSPKGLSEGRIWLWVWAKSVACPKNLNIPIERLFSELEWVLSELDHEDFLYVKYTSVPRRNLANLREFYKRYIKFPPKPDPDRSRYYKYARLVNGHYFKCMRLGVNRELISALIYIIEKTSNVQIKYRPMRPPWRRWGDEMGARILKKYVKQPAPLNRRVEKRPTRPFSVRVEAKKEPDHPPASSSSSGPECPVCLTTFASRKQAGIKIVVTNCGHIFCQPCITGSIDALGNRCPRCRNPARPVSGKFIEIYDF